MDFESPDVEKDFPGLYASESGRKSNESDFSDGGDHDKPSKKDLLGRRKDKKEKKDRGYAALEGESSPEEDTDAKSPSKSKKTKSFKFPVKSKEKHEKSRDKEKVLEDAVKQQQAEKEKKKEKDKKEKDKKEKHKEKDKEKEEKFKFKLESKEKLKDDKKDKVKEKEKEKSKEKDKEKVKEKEKEKTKEKEKDKSKDKEKDKSKEKEKEKVKEKDKEKVKEKDKDKIKKLTKMPSTVTAGVPFEEIFTLGVALPIFGVPLQQSVERMPCHDLTSLPLVVRDSIDYLEAHGIASSQIYRAEADKLKLQQLRNLYTERGATFPYHWDVPVACAILKSFLSELPESILTQELHGQFEQATAMSEPQREATVNALLKRLPTCNHNLVAWLVKHFEHVVKEEQTNHVSIQTLCTAMCPALNMSHNLLAYLVMKADTFFPNVQLTKYVPPLQSLPPDFPACSSAISLELVKQESLLSQLHGELHAGVAEPARDHDLWQAQRNVTQLKRMLRAIQKSAEPNNQPTPQLSVDEKQNEPEKSPNPPEILPAQPSVSQETQVTKEIIHEKLESPKPQEAVFDAEFEDNFEDQKEITNEVKIKELEPTDKPKLSENELKKLRLELENAEYLQLKSLLQAKINSEQFEIVKLRSQVALRNKQENAKEKDSNIKDSYTPEEQELRQKLLKENAMLEQKRMSLINQIFQERVACIQLKIELAMKELH